MMINDDDDDDDDGSARRDVAVTLFVLLLHLVTRTTSSTSSSLSGQMDADRPTHPSVIVDQARRVRFFPRESTRRLVPSRHRHVTSRLV